MVDTVRTRAELEALFADNSTNQVSAQDMRDFVVSTPIVVKGYGSPAVSAERIGDTYIDLDTGGEWIAVDTGNSPPLGDWKNVTRPRFRGAAIQRTTTTTQSPSGGYVIPFEEVLYDTDGFVNLGTDATRITIPAGVSRVRLTAYVDTNNAFGGAEIYLIRMLKNSSTNFYGTAVVNGEIGYNGYFSSCVSGMIPVVQNDYFQIQIFSNETNIGIETLTQMTLTVIE